MNAHSPKTASRGGPWAVAQFTPMLALLAAAPLWRGQWPGPWRWVTGGVPQAVGAWAGVCGERDLDKHRTPYPRPKDDSHLVTTGIHAQMRRPLYLADLALGFAWALLWRNWSALALAAAKMPFFDAKAHREERWLRERRADYDEYARRAKRFIPGNY